MITKKKKKHTTQKVINGMSVVKAKEHTEEKKWNEFSVKTHHTELLLNETHCSIH